MISGYVIFFSAKNRTALKFAVNRAVRLFPAYWFAVLFTSFFAYFWGGELMSTSLLRSVANLTMIHSFFGVSNVDGVYWTLAYEITFYFFVFCLLLVGLKNRLRLLFICWPFLLLVCYLVEINGYPLLGGYYYYFAAGCVFAVLMEKKSKAGYLSLAISYLLCLDYSTKKAVIFTELKGVYFSEFVIAAIVTIFFMLFLFQNTKFGQATKLPHSKTIGNLTYPIYLIHAHVGYMCLNQFATQESAGFVIFAITLVVIGVAYLINRLIEDRFHNVWVTIFSRLIINSGQFIEGYLIKWGARYP